jgi:hypothetical protein
MSPWTHEASSLKAYSKCRVIGRDLSGIPKSSPRLYGRLWSGIPPPTADAVKVLELAATAETLYESADMARKAQLLNILVLNGEVTGKSIAFSLTEPFRSISSARSVAPSGLGCYTPRTFSAEELVELVADCPRETLDTLRKTDFPALVESAQPA